MPQEPVRWLDAATVEQISNASIEKLVMLLERANKYYNESVFLNMDHLAENWVIEYNAIEEELIKRGYYDSSSFDKARDG